MKLEGQKLVDEIIRRAQQTNCGLGEQPSQSLRISDTFKGDGSEQVAMTLVNAFHAKYDLVSIIEATIETLSDNDKDQERNNG